MYVFLYDYAAGETVQITDNIYDDSFAGELIWPHSIHGGQLTWSGYDGNDREIYLYDHAIRETTQITNNNDGDWSPQIHDGQVMWQNDELMIFLATPTGAPPNQPPVASISQFKSDGITLIPEGGMTLENTVVFKGIVYDPDGDSVQLEIELRPIDEDFIGEPTPETISDPVPSGTWLTITRYGLVEGEYHWQYRAKDSHGATNDWKEYGTTGNIDFTVGWTFAIITDFHIGRNYEVINKNMNII